MRELAPDRTQEFDIAATRRPHDTLPGGRPGMTAEDAVPGYELIALIGAGGFGRVYKARQLNLGRLVALKVITTDRESDPSLAQRFEREALAVSRLHHPNLVQAYDFGRTADRMFLSMELLTGEDLSVRLRDRGPLDEWTTWHVVRQVAEGLAHAVAHGVVHRDVKPANLFLSSVQPGSGLPPDVPQVKVMDFGLALLKGAGDDPDRLTSLGIAIGTPTYMAPEQFRCDEVDLRADIYSLGATAAHALTGRPPFDGRTAWEVMARKLEQTPRSLPAGMDESTRLIAEMMHPDPKRRPQSYEQLLDRIDRLSIVRAGAALPPTPKPKHTRRAYRGATVGALVVCLTAACLVIRGSGDSSPTAPSPRYESDGTQESLFDGASLTRWAAAGAWSVNTDEEGTPVLSGSGLIRRPFVATPDYRLLLGLDVFNATAAELHFAIPRDPASTLRLVLRVSRAEGAVLGTRDGDREGRFQAFGPARPFPSPNWLKDRRPYLEVRVERVRGLWSVWFHGELVGRVSDDGTPKANELRHSALDGRVRVDTVVLERLRPVRR